MHWLTRQPGSFGRYWQRAGSTELRSRRCKLARDRGGVEACEPQPIERGQRLRNLGISSRAQLVIFCGYAAFAQIVAVRPNGNRRFCGPDAAAIRAAFNQEGELSTAIQLRRRSPGIADNARAREYARGASPGGRRCHSSHAS
jgi:hypothetical protein